MKRSESSPSSILLIMSDADPSSMETTTALSLEYSLEISVKAEAKFGSAKMVRDFVVLEYEVGMLKKRNIRFK